MNCKETKEEIIKLRRQKDDIQMMVYHYIKMNKNASHLLPEYYNIVNKIKELGGNVVIRSNYLKPEYWGTTLENLSKSHKTPKKLIESENKPLKDYNTYIIKLVWNDTIDNDIINHLKIILDKFCKYIDNEINEFQECVENILKYEYECDDNTFKMFKSYLNTTIDILNDGKNYNIELFGKKKLF